MTLSSPSSPADAADRRRRARLGTALLAIACLASVLAGTGPAGAGLAGAGSDDGKCSITQVTHTGRRQAGGGSVSMSGDGSRMAFASLANLTGRNPDHLLKIFLHDVHRQSTVQVPPSRTAQGGQPALSADGTTIAYAAGAIVHHDITTGIETQVTPPGTTNAAPAISADGTAIVYLHDTTSTGYGPYEVALVDVAATTTTTTIVEGIGLGRHDYEISPDISPDGTKVAYLGDHDPTGANPDGSLEVFVYDRTTHATVQATSAPGRSMGSPRFIEDGTKIVFPSTREFAGPNPGRQSHWFVYDLAAAAIARMSDLGAEGVISEDGSRIAYTDTANLHGTNPDESDELYSYDIATGAATQLTALAGPDHASGAVAHTQSADGTTIAFSSYTDPTGANSDHSLELFLATTCGPPPRPDTMVATIKDGPFAGDDIYAATAIPTQKRVATIRARQIRKFFVRVQNDRATTDTFTIHAATAGSPGYRVRFLVGRTDITPAVRAGTYETGPLEPGEVVTVKIKITATTARAGSGRRVDLTARSVTNPVTPDTIRARVTRR